VPSHKHPSPPPQDPARQGHWSEGYNLNLRVTVADRLAVLLREPGLAASPRGPRLLAVTWEKAPTNSVPGYHSTERIRARVEAAVKVLRVRAYFYQAYNTLPGHKRAIISILPPDPANPTHGELLRPNGPSPLLKDVDSI
jgi:hypothetical protein